MGLKFIKGVEIFAAGEWNGDTYTTEDLDEMVRAFKETGKQWRPALKLGHSDNQTLLQSDGLPAAGWVGNLYRKGKKLLADFIDIPEKVYEMLKNGSYKRVSSEVYWNAKVNGGSYSRLLGAVALLGADMPAVTCLNDIFQMYKKDCGEAHTYELDKKSFTIEIDKSDLESKGESKMTEQEEKDLKAKLAEAEKKNHSFTEAQNAKDKEIEALKKNSTDAQAKVLELTKQAEEAQVKADVAELSSSKLVTPAMKPYVTALLAGPVGEKKEFSVSLEAKKDKAGKEVKAAEEKKFSTKAGLLKEILKLHAASVSTVNVDENSVEGEVELEGGEDEAALNEKIEKYAKDNKVSYKAAYKALAKEQGSNAGGEEDDEDED